MSVTAFRPLAALVLAALVSTASPAGAAEGVIPIDPTTVTPPFVIAAPGSYRLMGNMIVGNLGASAISVTADEVSIDLNGFSLIGANSCTGSGSTISCSSGGGSGIDGPAADQVTVRNGTVRGFGAYGIHLQDDCRIVGVVVEENGSSGMDVGLGCIVRDSAAVRNGFYGIDASESENAFAGRAAILVSNRARGNQDDGLATADGSVMIGNTAYENGEDGLEGGGGVVIHGNSSNLNEDDGIHANIGSAVTLNSADDNGGYGLFFTVGGAGHAENVVSTTIGSAGTVQNGVALGGTACDGSLTCP